MDNQHGGSSMKATAIFEINNMQNDYAVCLDCIKLLEANDIPWENRKKNLSSLVNRKDFLRFVEGIPRGGYRYIEMPVSKGTPTIVQSEHRQLEDICTIEELHYHIRVNNVYAKGNTITELQWLAELLTRFDIFFDNNSPVKKLTVFLVPSSGNNYPYKSFEQTLDIETYKVASLFLRLLAKKYTGTIYGVIEKEGKSLVAPLEFSNTSRHNDFLPLILVHKNNYRNLFFDRLSDDTIDRLFKIKSPKRYGKAADDDPNKACIDFLLESAIYTIRAWLYNANSDFIEKSLIEAIKISNVSVIQLCFFSYTLNDGDFSSNASSYTDYYHKRLRLSAELCRGMDQIVQNSLQYAEQKVCFFSLCKRESNTIKIYISDYNDQFDALDKFRDCIKKEVDISKPELYEGHIGIINNKEKNAVRNFFSCFKKGDLSKEWLEFRRKDLAAHVGLGLFYYTSQKYGAKVRYISSKTTSVPDNNQYYNYDSSEKKDFFMPGTQAMIIIEENNVAEKEVNGVGQITNTDNMSEDYASYAHYLDYGVKSEKIWGFIETGFKQWSDNKMIDVEAKTSLITRLKNDISKRLVLATASEERKIYNLRICNPNNNEIIQSGEQSYWELFFKALILSIWSNVNGNEEVLIAISDLPYNSVKQFLGICIQMGACSFPKHLQIGLVEYKDTNMVVLLGNTFSGAVYNSYIYSIEQGVQGFDRNDVVRANDISKFFIGDAEKKDDKKIRRNTCPFDCIIKVSDDNNYSLFEQRILDVAEKSIDGDVPGYKIEKTHMRLGNRVHTESFYEMSYLFYRSGVSNRIAYLIIRDLMNVSHSDISMDNDDIMFYGYATYSKPIVTSLTEILREYRNSKGLSAKAHMAIYQHNYGLYGGQIQLNCRSDNTGKSTITRRTGKVIQIVPISTTLTTFDKMYEFFQRKNKDEKNRRLAANYTFFWAHDMNGTIESDEGTKIGRPSEIESKYWIDYSRHKRTITTKLRVLQSAKSEKVHFFVDKAIKWHDPSTCELCYPQVLINELPTVETDATSTVPTQQIRRDDNRNKSVIEQADNIQRLLRLRDSVYYGHISRENNHFQYYIDTQKFFDNNADDIRIWLKNQRASNRETHAELNIIFSPEHNTNAGFAQYVNMYCFDGMAELVSFNINKEYRSNFICENWSLKNLIDKLLSEEKDDSKDISVNFYFADDAIITGDTYMRANSFMRSLLPADKQTTYGDNIFKRIFVLVDRLSDDSKKKFISDIKEFRSYVHIDISNMRNHGDSCIGCRLYRTSKNLFKRSTTKLTSDYWTEKVKKYKPIEFDDFDEMKKTGGKNAFDRLIMSHILQNLIVKSGKCHRPGETYDVLLDISMWFLGINREILPALDNYKILLSEMVGIEGIKHLLKIVCRPFFTYDYKIRQQVLTFCIAITQYVLKEKNFFCDLNETHLYLKSKSRIERTALICERLCEILNKENRSQFLSFLSDYLIEGLADMNSNYIARLQTISAMYNLIEDKQADYDKNDKRDFWRKYAANFQRFFDNTADEKKELRLEWLCTVGYEGKEGNPMPESVDGKFLYETITGKQKPEYDDQYFYIFCHVIFFQNAVLNFDGLEKISNTDEGADQYFMESWNAARSLDAQIIFGKDKKLSSLTEHKLFDSLKKENLNAGNSGPSGINSWYDNLITIFQNMIVEKYELKEQDVDVALLTEYQDQNENIDQIQNFDYVAKCLGKNDTIQTNVLYKIKGRIANIANRGDEWDSIDHNGYYIYEDDKRPYVVVLFDNPKDQTEENAGRSLKWIKKVYFYASIKCENACKFFLVRFILRDLLTYRNRIMRFLERDFAGDIYSKYARTVGENNIITMIKAASHASTGDDELAAGYILKRRNNVEKSLSNEECFRWILIRNYTNGIIAKLFNRSFRADKEDSAINSEIPPLYVGDKYAESEELYAEKLCTFSQLGLEEGENSDIRFNDIKTLADIQITGLQESFFITSGEEGYNVEYFKCILVDILFSAIKYQCEENDFIKRIITAKYRKEDSSRIINEDDREWDSDRPCYIYIYKEITEIGADYLVVKNPVDAVYTQDGYDYMNKEIKYRLSNPLDNPNGHLSLLTIKRYIENLCQENESKCKFEYYKDTQSSKYFFLTKLPVIMKEKH